MLFVLSINLFSQEQSDDGTYLYRMPKYKRFYIFRLSNPDGVCKYLGHAKGAATGSVEFTTICPGCVNHKTVKSMINHHGHLVNNIKGYDHEVIKHISCFNNDHQKISSRRYEERYEIENKTRLLNPKFKYGQDIRQISVTSDLDAVCKIFGLKYYQPHSLVKKSFCPSCSYHQSITAKILANAIGIEKRGIKQEVISEISCQ
jgi:hypothetical protein